jgi:hypothetical protein
MYRIGKERSLIILNMYGGSLKQKLPSTWLKQISVNYFNCYILIHLNDIYIFWMNNLHLLNNKHNTRLKQTGSHLLQNSQQTRPYLQSYNSKPQTATNALSTTSDY